MIIVCQNLLKDTKISAITIFPFILLRKKEYLENKTLINHEKIHLRQQKELLIVPFYLWYVLEFYFWFFKLKNKDLAYRRICFERESYENENNLKYLKSRRLWNFKKYMKNNKDA